MTLTAQGCGMGPVIADDARQKLESLPSVSSATVEIVWDPPWNPHMISEEGQANGDVATRQEQQAGRSIISAFSQLGLVTKPL